MGRTTKGMCGTHYCQVRRTGSPDAHVYQRGVPAIDRILNRCVPQDDCLIFTGSLTKTGYGMVNIDGKCKRTHRVVLIHHIGPPTDPTHEVLHSCHNRACCNIEHLRWGTHAENIADAVARRRAAAQNQ